jgi:Na+/phosphate symporter
MAAKSDSAKHVANLRTRRRAAGLVQNTVWSMPTDKDLLKAVEKGALAGEDGATVLRRALQMRPVARPETLEALEAAKKEIVELGNRLNMISEEKGITEKKVSELQKSIEKRDANIAEKSKELREYRIALDDERKKGIFKLIKERYFTL